ncbi:MAG: hypothetical protein DLM62_21035 [Pseudonocardiales bacterium]|nr:MAG: hypothetical protein DLM62_21035 [Pseudonocardiales bacterium]
MDISRSIPQDFPRTAIVTGSDSGIGKAAAIAVAEMGCDVGITWHADEHGAQTTAQEVRAAGPRAQIRHLDLTILPDTANVIDELAELSWWNGLGVARRVSARPLPPHKERGGSITYVPWPATSREKLPATATTHNAIVLPRTSLTVIRHGSNAYTDE